MLLPNMWVLLAQYGGDPVTLVTLCHYASGHKIMLVDIKKIMLTNINNKKNMWPNLSNNKNSIIKLTKH